ncbi:reverse transcriptase domain-containing protein [uncultured Sulfitobacter sp.]|uniref:reverse transcriptase domain-containing protein n=1 Tax=uncultured Sulfitobacter sp. TaxID=191468 RepID=UPI0030F562F2
MKTSADFFRYDYRSSLFPMATTKFLVDFGGSRLLEHSKKCVEGKQNFDFLPQVRAYASKPKRHLRRTTKLDPSAEYFLYDLIYRNRALFLEPKLDNREHYGYRFDEDDIPTSATETYGAFRSANSDYERQYKHSLSFDVASYFNSIRHDDIVEWLHIIGMNSDDLRALDTFLEQSNSGRSSDCWPQGIYPAKVMGNDFLRFSEENSSLKATKIIRFMDDFVLFSDSESDLIEDFFLFQKIIGARGLSVNPSKTFFRNLDTKNENEDILEVRARLLAKRRNAIQLAYAEDFDDAHGGIELEADELEYIQKLLNSNDLSEDDAELVLSVSRTQPESVKKHLTRLTIQYPHLAKGIWSFCDTLNDIEVVHKLVTEVSRDPSIQEYQLFWLSQILSDVADNLIVEGWGIAEISQNIYNHKNATDLSKAKLLEIDIQDPGLMEWRRDHLTSGRSDWLVWASAIGHRSIIQNATVRRFSSFANASSINELILDIVRNPDKEGSA